MRTDVTSPQGIFAQPQHLTVPPYQRPYVWTDENQWGPLWLDVRRIAEHRLGTPGAFATHFLGAIVTQQAESQPTGVQEFAIVDGQQRLTTLQLLLDATAAALTEHGLDAFAGQLQFLTHNGPMFVSADDTSGLKLRHTNRDRAAFDEVMLAEPPIDYSALTHRASLLTQAHEYFSSRVGRWLVDGPQSAAVRGEALSVALSSALQLVVIRLDASEDSQEIFETLNARGTPLTAADLIKNFVFQRMKTDGGGSTQILGDRWPFETPFWEQEVSVGRTSTTRSAAFLNQWIVSRVGQEVGPRSTFSRFKFYVEHETSRTMSELWEDITRQAAFYAEVTERSMEKHADLDPVALHVYRMSVTQSEITKPILLWLTEPATPYAQRTVDRVLAVVESWVFRRRLLRLQSSDQGRIAAALITTGRGVSDADLVSAIEGFLAGQQFASTYWPGDDEIRSALATEAFYRRFSQPIQRVVLQAVEDWYRGYTSNAPSKTGIRAHRDKQQVEHLIPRSWRANWPVADFASQADRDDHVNRLGNLTLITGALNASVSNGPWLGAVGKRAALNKHDTFLMNRRLYESSRDGWDEERIDARTDELTTALLETWPVPAGHKGEVIDRQSRITKATATYGDLINAGMLDVGTVLTCTDQRWIDAQCTMLAGGAVLYEGETYASPAAAARKVRGGSGNAWWFWRVQNGPVLNTLRDRLIAATPQDAEAAPEP